MYTVCVRDHVMIAHSLHGEMFGSAERMHGATYIVDVEFSRGELAPEGVVVDIERAAAALRAVLDELRFRNLDEIPMFAGVNTTTEFLARFVFDRLAHHVSNGELGPGSTHLAKMKVTLHESHVAWAAYEGSLPA